MSEITATAVASDLPDVVSKPIKKINSQDICRVLSDICVSTTVDVTAVVKTPITLHTEYGTKEGKPLGDFHSVRSDACTYIHTLCRLRHQDKAEMAPEGGALKQKAVWKGQAAICMM